MSSTALLVTLGAVLGRVPCALHMMRRASIHAEVLTEVANDCGAVMGLLLTRLEVEAHHGPHSFHRHPHQQELWRAGSCSSTFLLLQRSSTNGGPLFVASSETVAPLGHRMPAETVLEAMQP